MRNVWAKGCKSVDQEQLRDIVDSAKGGTIYGASPVAKMNEQTRRHANIATRKLGGGHLVIGYIKAPSYDDRI